MINFSNTHIETLSIHKVGNKLRNENIFISNTPTELNDDDTELLLKYFIKPFTNITDEYQFVHQTDLAYNVVNGLTRKALEENLEFHKYSIEILKYLYDQSNHPQIKSGDLFIVKFNEVIFEDEVISAIGIFKSENKDSYIKLVEAQSQIIVNKEKGINIKKLDKGCLILNTNSQNGFIVLTVDNNNYDSEYWIKNFLNVDHTNSSNIETKLYIDLCKSFANDVIRPNLSKKEQIDFLNQSVQYFDSNDRIQLEDFKEKVFNSDSLSKDFDEYRHNYELNNSFQIPNEFDLSKTVIQKQKKAIKNFIQLDTNIQIKLDFKNPESSKKFIETGYDREKGMNYYKVFYNKELN
jgi:hypothetical protein